MCYTLSGKFSKVGLGGHSNNRLLLLVYTMIESDGRERHKL